MINFHNIPNYLKYIGVAAAMAIGAGVADKLHLYECQNELQNRIAALSNRIETLKKLETASIQLSGCKKALESCSYFQEAPSTPDYWQKTLGGTWADLIKQLTAKGYDVIPVNGGMPHSCLTSLDALKTHTWTNDLPRLGKEASIRQEMYDSFQKCETVASKNPVLTQATWSTLDPWRYSSSHHCAHITAQTHRVIKHSVRTTCAQELTSASMKLDNILKALANLKDDLSAGFPQLECPQWHVKSLLTGAVYGAGLSLVILAIRRLWPY